MRLAVAASLFIALGDSGAAAQTQQPAAAPRASMTLSESFKLALAHNERVLIAQEAVALADLQWFAAWAEMGPSLTLSASGEVGAKTPPFREGGYLLQGQANLNQPLFRKSFFDAREAGELGFKSAESSLMRTKQQLMRDVVFVFINVLRARRQIEISRAAVKRAEAQAQSATSRVKAGGGLRTAELQASIDLRRAQLQLNSSERDARSAEASFLTLIGEAPPKTLELPSTPQVPKVQDALAQLEKRSDIQAARLLTLQSRAQEEAARGRRLWPRLDAQAGAVINRPSSNPENFGGTGKDWFVVGVLTLPIFDTGNELIAVDLQENATRVFELQERLLLETSSEDVRRASIRVDAEDRNAQLAEKQVKDALDNYELVATQFRLGAITFLDVANAQALLTEAENLKVVAIYDREIARYELLFAAGTLSLE